MFVTFSLSNKATPLKTKRRIVLGNYIVTISINSEEKYFEEKLKVFDCLVQIYSNKDSFSIHGDCVVKNWNGWKTDKKVFGEEAIKWSSHMRDLSFCGNHSSVMEKNVSIGRNELLAKTEHQLFRSGSSSYFEALNHARKALMHWPENIQYRLDLAKTLLFQECTGDENVWEYNVRIEEGLKHCKTVVSEARRTHKALLKEENIKIEKKEVTAAAVKTQSATTTTDVTAMSAVKRESLSAYIADAYQMIGDSHAFKNRRGKIAHAISAYTLALLHDPDRIEVQKALGRCLSWKEEENTEEKVESAMTAVTSDITLDIETTPTTSLATRTTQSIPDDTTTNNANATTKYSRAKDIEDLLTHHTVLSGSDKANFSCTMCGECCRHADYIFLSPVDLWRIMKAPSMSHKRKKWSSSTTLDNNNKEKNNNQFYMKKLNYMFKGALKWTTRKGLPICYLSPKREKLRCHFAYPLYRKQNDESTLLVPEKAWALEVHHLTTTHQQAGPTLTKINERGEKCTENREFNDSSLFVPLAQSEFDFTSEDFEAWKKEDQERGENDEEYVEEGEIVIADNEDAHNEEHAADAEEEGEDCTIGKEGETKVSRSTGRKSTTKNTEKKLSLDELSSVPIKNTFGRPALGCSLGSENMPTMCSSYPLARELTLADFWHQDDKQVHGSNSEHNHYILIHNDACEGFNKPGESITSLTENPSYVPMNEEGENNTLQEQQPQQQPQSQPQPQPQQPQQPQQPLKPSQDSKKLNGFNRTVSEFLSDNNMAHRWKEQDWFVSMMNDLTSTGKTGLMLLYSFSNYTNSSIIQPLYYSGLGNIW
jgi:hypothetical protein